MLAHLAFEAVADALEHFVVDLRKHFGGAVGVVLGFQPVGRSLEHEHRSRVVADVLVEVVLDGVDGVNVAQVDPQAVGFGGVLGCAEHVDRQAVDDERGVEQHEAGHVGRALGGDHRAHRAALALAEQEHGALVHLGKRAYDVEHGGKVGCLGLYGMVGRLARRARLLGASAEVERIGDVAPRRDLAGIAPASLMRAAEHMRADNRG